ncbi:signal transduction histidine kinase/CheY-like chemotaxis protein [Sphingomonas kaistensis]|uniref:histidine kinase n=1 Tax=Sphingomonas kaistensis TaxID=298708 RepID=A0A7X5Y4T9_9SPHN|nr:response regulator [Sphingomonas kaistensis]NJC04728.1 signal transduction histidine kinase/CheY-like chemotaxis protein [Sphingomonas kaistensis]
MLDSAKAFFSGDYAPHGYCLLWQPELIWTHVVSDALIAASYFSIPVALVTFVRKRPDIEFGKMFWLFALFIMSCGLTHIMGIWNLWNGDYAAEATIKAITAIASVPTAILLWPLLPKALAIPSPSMLQKKNDELAAALAERDAALEQLRGEVAQRERAEAALVQANKMEAVGQLTGGIAHDFNNLLQAISGNLELIKLAPDNKDKVLRWAANAALASERGAKLTGQLLTFSRRQRLEATDIDVGKLLRDMSGLLRNSVGPTVDLQVDVGPDLGTVRSDATQLELAIINLAINGRDAMPSGGRLLVRAEVDAADRVAVRIVDQGVGMTPDIVARALEPFFTTKGPGRGTGLGLSMAYGVARAAGGDLRIDSEPGEGTAVTLLLPRTPAAEAAAPAVRGGGQSASPGRKVNVLLVDDDPEVRQAVADMLRADGHRVTEAENGPQALLELERMTPDLALFDYAMPGMNGAQLAARVLEQHPDLKLLFLTGYADSDAIDKAVNGRARILKKPISAAALSASLDELLS